MENTERIEHRYFVSNYFLERMFDNLMLDVERMRETMEKIMEKTIARVDELMAVRDREFPEYDKRIKGLNNKITLVNKIILNKTCEDRNTKTKSFCLQVLVAEAVNGKKEKTSIKNMIRHFSKLQLYHVFRKYHRNSNYEAALKDKSKIDGAYLLLKRFKNRLKNYDLALAQIEGRKADKQELTQLAKRVDNANVLTIFKDM